MILSMKYFQKSLLPFFHFILFLFLSSGCTFFPADFVFPETGFSTLCLTQSKTNSDEPISLLQKLPISSSSLDLGSFGIFASPSHSHSKFSNPLTHYKYLFISDTYISVLPIEFYQILTSYQYQFSPRAPPLSHT